MTKTKKVLFRGDVNFKWKETWVRCRKPCEVFVVIVPLNFHTKVVINIVISVSLVFGSLKLLLYTWSHSCPRNNLVRPVGRDYPSFKEESGLERLRSLLLWQKTGVAGIMFVHFEAEMNGCREPRQDGKSEWTKSQGVFGDGHGLRATELIACLSGPSWSTPSGLLGRSVP